MAEWVEEIADIGELLLDRQIFASDGEPLGKVDDLEFSVPDDGGPPVLVAILCGPTALGPRLGGALGLGWWSLGRRLRPHGDPHPFRIPFEQVAKVDRKEIVLTVPGTETEPNAMRDWARDKIVSRIPGGTS